MQDLTSYSDDELSLLVFNTEYLYNLRNNKYMLISELDSLFNYTFAQYNVLMYDLENEEA